ncbi:hypothetical protein [Limosilactobacillus agrestimuris]|uniref:hypothetical protein n=1 Tax=Limosilactobacillus agrestimuris TaxID=2941331 RepID=UPI00203F2720|nr:hypothetical protein [Limosilactobacillus agrestimuris]
MRYLTNENDTNVFKASDSSEIIRLSARNDNEPVTWDNDNVAKIHIDKDKAHVKDIDATLITGSNNVTFSTSELADLPAGDYQLELWTKLSDGVNAIWPSQGMLEFTIDRNADSLEGGAITVITLDDFKKQLNNAIDEAEKKAVPGKSAYEEWLDAGNKGSKEDFLKSLKGEKGDGGDTGQPGPSGKSAYQVAVDNGFKGTEKEWLDYLRKGPVGPDGKSSYQIWLDAGNKGSEEDFLKSLVGPQGDQGLTGKSAYDIWKDAGNVGDEKAFLKSLVGPKGDSGKSAYQLAVEGGFAGTEKEWINSLKGQDAYQLAVDSGYQGDLKSWLASLKGEKGDQGLPGKDAVAPKLKMGGVKSVASDQPAQADLVDNHDNTYTLTLSIPAGAKGETGGVNQVIKPQLTIGTITSVGSDEKPSASLTKTGETSYAINLSIPSGKAGADGVGKPGADGKSAYDLAVENGFKGDLQSWLNSLKGPAGKDAVGAPGKDGESAYQIWLDQGNTGDKQAFLNSLKGTQGAPGKDAIGTPGRDGKRGTAIFLSSDTVSTRMSPMTVSLTALSSADSTLKPEVGDYVIADDNFANGQMLLQINNVTDSTAELSSNFVKIEGKQGLTGTQGKGIWFYTKGSVSNLSHAQVSDLAGYESYGTQPLYDDVVIGTDGSVSTISMFTAYASDGTTPTQFSTNAATANIGGQSEASTNANFDYDKLPKLTIVDQDQLGKYLSLDSSKSYTLDVDNFTLNDGTNDIKKFLKPGIYLLRDIANHGYNLTIKSSSNMASTYATPVQLIVTPYTVIATAAEGSTAVWFIRTDWSHDSMPYYGMNNGWTKLAEGPKSVQ